MSLPSSYDRLRPSIVAFVPRWEPRKPGDPRRPFEHIIGTGFIAREDGVIITNDHVVRAFPRIPTPPWAGPDDWAVYAKLFHPTDEGIFEVPLDILGVGTIEEFDGGAVCYGGKPDVAVVHVKAVGLPAVTVDHTTSLAEGQEVATAGFSMGTRALVAPGWLHQISPTLQRGIVSALLPFPADQYHGFAINVMTQGGASGSPVFLPDTGDVVGVLYAGLSDLDRTQGGDVHRLPTNISYVVPAHAVRKTLDGVEGVQKLKQPDDAPTVQQLIDTLERVDRYEESKDLRIRQVKRSEPGERRMQELSPREPEESPEDEVA